MRYLPFIIIILFLTVGSNGQKYKAFENLNSKEFKEKLSKESGILIDVRTLNEYKSQHIKDAGQLNFYALDFKKKLLLLPKDIDVLLYCNTGYRSRIAANILMKNGYLNVYNLKSGIMDWNLHNYPTITDTNIKKDEKNKMDYAGFVDLINANNLSLIDFYAPWCAPCRKMMPMIDSLKTEFHGKVHIEKINTDTSKDLVKKIKVKSVPYFVLYQDGDKVFEHYGNISRKELLDKFSTFLQ